ncbi:MAG: protein kinase [Clostridia bacterium]|nr:protein kinase [Clostridia bacterium]
MFRQDANIANPMPFGPQWVIDRQLGRGSYGAVYQVSRHDAGEAILSAMKWIPLPGDGQEVQAMREKGLSDEQIRGYYDRVKADFIGEIQLLYKLRGNSHVVSIEDYRIEPRAGEDAIGYDLYILMELLTPLPKWLDRHPDATFGDVLRLGKDLCDALEDCARLSILHRDIKPDNIFVTADGRFKLGDFGIARRLQRDDLNASQRVGNLGTMSPEVFHSQNYDERADLYSLGLVLYRLANGKREPFTPPYPEAVTPDVAARANQRRLAGESLPRPANLPESLDRLWDVIQIACAYSPDSRYSSAAEMRQALMSLDRLPALDTPISSARVPAAAGKPAEPPASDQPPVSSGSMDRTLHRSRSSFSDLNSTVGRHSGSANRAEPEDADHTGEATGSGKTPPERKKPPLRLILTAGAVLVAIVIAIVLLVPGLRDGTPGNSAPAAAAKGPELVVGRTTPTSATLLWHGLTGKQLRISCYDGDTIIRTVQVPGSPYTLEGLVPDHAYHVTVQSDARGAEPLSADIVTQRAETPADAPMIRGVYVERVSRTRLPSGYAGGVPEVDESDFRIVGDRSISLRAAPLTVQTQSYVYDLNITFQSPGIGRQTELVLSFVIPDGTAFSRQYVLNPPDSGEEGDLLSYRIPLDELLKDIYAAYSRWPAGTASAKLYLDGMSVYECEISLKNDAGV